MKILVVADIHGVLDSLSRLITTVGRDFDAIICPGDFTDMYSVPKEFSQIDIAELIVQKLLSLGKPVLCVPGNHDPYEIIDVFDDYDINLHANTKRVGGETFIGWGGAPTPFNTIFEPTDDETKETLDSLGTKADKRFILVTHDPPKDTNLDKVESGDHVGSPVIRGFIEKKQPILAISAHIHESGGQDKIGDSTLFYPGALFSGKYGVVEIEGDNVKCEIKSLGKSVK
ncbi:MAG: metallophosphoesterase [Candidatus Aenigmatarchaeota archaeon]|nr:MAG: metallophosphoesterase [Candidatus Aenigmarchaeota archaeon]